MSNDKIKEIIMDKLGVEESKITMEANFINDLGADSLDQVELIMELEEKFEIEITDEDAESLVTVEKVYEYIKTHCH
tara:strand:+ start:356 stop:586 length:231 start_codon:yes stop_codon:yes gene_type:complete